MCAIAGLIRSGRVIVLATLRSDFYPSYQRFPDLIELTKPGGKVDLRPPTAYEIGNIIRLPAEAAGINFERDPETGQPLDQALRDAASTTLESLPLLEYVLSLLYKKQVARGDGLLRWSDYRELGELKGALAKHAEAIFGTLELHEQKAFPTVMRHLVTLSQGEEEVPSRRTVPYHAFVTSEGTHDDHNTGAKGFVGLFVKERLLVGDINPDGEVTVSVAHEALLREWQRIKEWLAQNHEFLRMRDRLDSSLSLWLSRGKQRDDLLGPGLPLAEGEKLLTGLEQSLTREQVDYIRASIAARKRSKQIQERIRYTVMGVITILAVVAGFQWFRADQQRRAAAQAFKSEAQVAAKLKEQLRQASLGELQPGRSSVPGGRVAGGHRSSCACDQVQPAKPGCFRTILPGINPASRKGATLAYRILNLPRFSRRCGVQSRWGSDIDCELGQDCQALGCGHGQNHR